MFYASLLLLASAGATSALTVTTQAQSDSASASASSAPVSTAPACENFSNATTLLQDNDGEVYCSSILSLGTITNTLIESTTTFTTTTITNTIETTTTDTTTQTDTISSGTSTTTAPVEEVTTTTTSTTTAYACPSGVFRRDLPGQLMAYGAGKTTSSPVPTSTPDESFDDDCDEGDDSETFPNEYNTYSPAYITVYPSSAPQGKVLTLSSYLDHSAAPSSTPYAYSSGALNPPYSYSNGPSNSPYSYPSNTPVPHISGNSTIYHTGAATGSSKSSQPIISSNSTIPSTGTMSASSMILTTAPIVTPTPAPVPKPSCDAAPTAVRTGFACETINAACGCLGLSPTTEDVTSTTTITNTIFTTTTTTVTTGTLLTETESITVPATTETYTPSTTVTETSISTQTTCPCSGSTSTLCGLTPDTCKDLQTDTNNCGTCGNTCGSGKECDAGKCVTPAIPNSPSCATSSCGKYIPCGNGGNCVCSATTEGKGVCVLGTTSCSNPACSKSSDCGVDQVCAINSCCRGGSGICIRPANVCPNSSNPIKMFKRRTWDGETIGGGM